MNGHYEGILSELETKMNEASEAMEFEKAIEYRELLNSVRKVAQKQKITDTGGEDRDILAAATEGEDAVVQVFLSGAEGSSAGTIFTFGFPKMNPSGASWTALSSSITEEHRLFRENWCCRRSRRIGS